MKLKMAPYYSFLSFKVKGQQGMFIKEKISFAIFCYIKHYLAIDLNGWKDDGIEKDYV